MPWVARPERTSSYLIREARGADSYIPGTVVTIEVVVTKYDMKYRGLLADAVDAGGETVGSFDWLSRKDSVVWEPPLCPGAVIHINADPKPFVSRFNEVGTLALAWSVIFHRSPPRCLYLQSNCTTLEGGRSTILQRVVTCS